MFRTILHASIAMTAVLTLSSIAGGQSFRSVDFGLGKLPQGLAAADLNNDGLIDLAVATVSPPAIHIIYATFGGGFEAQLAIPLEDDSVGKLIAGDVNADGQVDLLIAMPRLEEVVVFANGREGFMRYDTFRTGALPHGLALGDVDANGTMDVVVANEGSDSVTVALQKAGRFYGYDVRTGMGPRHVALADLHGGRSPELFVSNYNEGNVMIFTNRGGEFALFQTLAAGSASPDGMVLRDLDKDGDLDISIASSGRGRDASKVVVWTNTRGMFDRFSEFPSRSESAVGLASADFDNDGFDDLVVSDRSGDVVSIMYGQRDGTYSAENRISVGFGPDEVLALDVDGDGDVDMVTMNSDGDGITILLNQMR